MYERALGQTLERVIAAHGGFGIPVARSRRIMGHVACALVASNEAGVIRGGLSPSDILVVSDNDTDLVSIVEHATADPSPHLSYFAPERSGLSQATIGWSTDVFPLAAILYEVLSGSRAFPRDAAFEIARHMMLGPVPSLACTVATLPVELRDRPDLVAALDAHLARALSGDPQVRHANVQQFWLDVDPILREAVRPTAGGHRHLDGKMQQDEPNRVPSPLPFNAFAPASKDKPEFVTSTTLPSDPMLDSRVAWEILGPPIAVEQLHASMLVEDGRAILAAGRRGLYRLVRGAWSRVPLPTGVEMRSVRGLSRLATGELLLFGDPDFCVAVSARGAAQRIALPDRDITLHAAHADDRGVVLVGERVSRPVGAAIILPRGAPASAITIDSAQRLTDVTRLINGTIVAVGLHGAIVELGEQSSREVPWARSGHLYAVATGMFGAAYAVGSGGHAVRIEPSPTGGPLVATLERVQTTRDLFSVAADFRSGAVWAAGADARLLQRRDDAWVRVPLDPSHASNLLRVHLRAPRVVVVAEDGSAFVHEASV